MSDAVIPCPVGTVTTVLKNGSEMVVPLAWFIAMAGPAVSTVKLRVRVDVLTTARVLP